VNTAPMVVWLAQSWDISNVLCARWVVESDLVRDPGGWTRSGKATQLHGDPDILLVRMI